MVPQHNKFTAGRYLHVLAVAKGNLVGALSYAEGRGDWNDRDKVVSQCKTEIAAMGSNDYPLGTPVSESFLPLMRPYSIPLQLASAMRAVPMHTRLYVALAGAKGAEVAEGRAIPVSSGELATQVLKPRSFGALILSTKELATSSSPVATQANADSLAKAVADAENATFVSPTEPGSVLYGQESFAGTGNTVEEIHADLKRLVDLLPATQLPGATFIMAKETATALSIKRGAGGNLAYPTIGPTGGTLMGLPVIVTPSMAGYVGLLAPSQIFWADEGVVQLSTSTEAAIEMTDAPTGDSLTPTASEMVSMYQSESIALKAVRQSNWYAKPGAAAYFSADY